MNDESGLLGPETKGGMMTIAPAEAEPIAEVQVVAIKNDGTKEHNDFFPNNYNISKEKNNADKLNRLEEVKIPDSFDYSKIKSMSFEAREKLKKVQPKTVSQASRISGVSPNDISVLLVYMGR